MTIKVSKEMRKRIDAMKNKKELLLPNPVPLVGISEKLIISTP